MLEAEPLNPQLVFQFRKEGRYLGGNALSHLALDVERLLLLQGVAPPGQDDPNQQQGTDGQAHECDG